MRETGWDDALGVGAGDATRDGIRAGEGASDAPGVAGVCAGIVSGLTADSVGVLAGGGRGNEGIGG